VNPPEVLAGPVLRRADASLGAYPNWTILAADGTPELSTATA
jgi:hypothetical protein